jgi:tRNA(Ile)-lysidine synthase
MTRASGEAPPQASSEPSPEKVADDFLKRLPASCRLLVALSGGGDSTGLLVALSEARRTHPGVTLHSATVDHGLRSGSAEEAEAAWRMSRKLGVPNATLRWVGNKPATGIQAAARGARYELLAAEAQRIGADFIVTGHNRDDQAETIFMRGLRKPTLLAGMDEAVLVERQVWVLRPFLDVGREPIRDYLRKRRLTWSEDPSNDNPAFERVRIRRSGVLAGSPAKKEYVPNHYVVSAQFARDHVKVYPGPVAVVDLRECHVRYHPYWEVLATLAAIIGGREYGPGGETAARLTNKLAASADFRATANRVLFDRRGHLLYLYREERGLAELSIAPGESAYWDGRYEITNRGSARVTVGAGRGVTAAAPLLSLEPSDALPADISKRAITSLPRIFEGKSVALEVRTVLAPFDKFVPSRKLDLANNLATAFELEQFPLLSLGNGAF